MFWIQSVRSLVRIFNGWVVLSVEKSKGTTSCPKLSNPKPTCDTKDLDAKYWPQNRFAGRCCPNYKHSMLTGTPRTPEFYCLTFEICWFLWNPLISISFQFEGTSLLFSTFSAEALEAHNLSSLSCSRPCCMHFLQLEDTAGMMNGSLVSALFGCSCKGTCI